MRVYKLTTNEGYEYVRSTNERLQAAMYSYIRTKRKSGYSLASIVYCWSPITISTI